MPWQECLGAYKGIHLSKVRCMFSNARGMHACSSRTCSRRRRVASASRLVAACWHGCAVQSRRPARTRAALATPLAGQDMLLYEGVKRIAVRSQWRCMIVAAVRHRRRRLTEVIAGAVRIRRDSARCLAVELGVYCSVHPALKQTISDHNTRQP